MQQQELLKQLKSAKPPIVIDVRSGFEFRSGHIPGAIHLPSMNILFQRSALPKDKNHPLVVTCEHGPRAGMAFGLLGLFGYKNVELLDGHMSAWRSKRFPMEM